MCLDTVFTCFWYLCFRMMAGQVYSHHIPRVEVVEMIQHWSSHEHLGGHCDLVVNATDYIAEDCGFDSQQLSLKLKNTAYPGVMDYGYLVERWYVPHSPQGYENATSVCSWPIGWIVASAELRGEKRTKYLYLISPNRSIWSVSFCTIIPSQSKLMIHCDNMLC